MRPKKQFQPASPTKTSTEKVALATVDQSKSHGQEEANLMANEAILAKMLVGQDLSAVQMGGVVLTLIVYASEKRAKPMYLASLVSTGMHLVSLLEGWKAEVRLLRALDLPDEKAIPLLEAAKVSQDEIGSIRKLLGTMFEELRQIPPYWVVRN